MDIIVLKKH